MRESLRTCNLVFGATLPTPAWMVAAFLFSYSAHLIISQTQYIKIAVKITTLQLSFCIFEFILTMKAELNISLTFQQILDLVRQLPRQQKIKLSKELEKEAIDIKLSQILQSFRTDELSEDLLEEEKEAVRQQLYERSKKQ